MRLEKAVRWVLGDVVPLIKTTSALFYFQTIDRNAFRNDRLSHRKIWTYYILKHLIQKWLSVFKAHLHQSCMKQLPLYKDYCIVMTSRWRIIWFCYWFLSSFIILDAISTIFPTAWPPETDKFYRFHIKCAHNPPCKIRTKSSLWLYSESSDMISI